jgi:hypothetical protein
MMEANMPNHPNSMKNLRAPWKKGQSGNPAGRPKRRTFEELVHDVLSEEVEGEVGIKADGSRYTKKEVLAKVFVDQLLKRDGKMLREYMAREWPVKQIIEGALEVESQHLPFGSAFLKPEEADEDAPEQFAPKPDGETLQ